MKLFLCMFSISLNCTLLQHFIIIYLEFQFFLLATVTVTVTYKI